MSFMNRLAGAGVIAMAIAGAAAPATAGDENGKVNGKGNGPGWNTKEPAQMKGLDGWTVEPIFTVGETVEGYRPVGLLDGIGATALNNQVVRVFVNHEVAANRGYVYTLANGTTLRGGRVSYFDINRANRKLVGAGTAYDSVVDRAGNTVTTAQQINEGSSTVDGLDRLCSSFLYEAGTYGLVDDIFFTGEEASNGQLFALDVANRVLYCVPQFGRAAFENVTALSAGDPNTVAFLIGDDRQTAPLYLYVGTKNALGNGGFLDRNGLASGRLYAWKADNGDLSPQQFNGTGNSRMGTFVEIAHYDPSKAGMAGYDALGYANQATLDALTAAAGAFKFSRPEDLSTNPANGLQVAFASTGRGSVFPADTWGTTYIVDVTLGAVPAANVKIIYDGDDAGAGQFAGPDYGLRNPDNLDWADDGLVYIQEDRSTEPSSLFGGTSGKEASIWKLDPSSGVLSRIAMIDRTALPTGQTDPNPADIGNWESSGIMDVTSLFQTLPGEILFVADVEAHNVVGAPLGAPNQVNDLVEGGQLVLLSYRTVPPVEDGQDGGESGEASDDAAGVTLGANTPNPFNPTTTIRFSLAQSTEVSLRIYNAQGQLVRELVNEARSAGDHAVTWDGRNDAGSGVASGVYFYRLQAAGFSETRRMVLLK